MTKQVVVLGSGYAGAGAIKSLETALPGDVDLRWISDVDYHFVLHESHRCIRDPSIREKITIPVGAIKSPETEFRQATVVGVDTDERTVQLANGEVGYDYLVVGMGSDTAFFGIDGLEEYAHTLNSLDDVLGIHDGVTRRAEVATHGDPVQVVIGGAGLTGIQVAGEIAALRDEQGYPIDIHLVEGLDEIYPDGTPQVRQWIRTRLEQRDIDIWTGQFVRTVDDETVSVGDDTELAYDMLVWTGGVTGRTALEEIGVGADERTGRLTTGQNFQTENERVFAIGDAAFIDQPDGHAAPPTAQAAWQAAEIVGNNIARQMESKPLRKWVFENKGTAISVGEDAVAHGVSIVPFLDAFNGFPAKTLKKAIAARWITDIDGLGRALAAWPDM